MALEKIYTPIGWQNKPSTATPLGSHNLSKMDEALDEIDTRLVELSGDTELLDGKVEEAKADITQNAGDITSLNNSFTGFSTVVSQGMQQLFDRVDEAEDKIENNTEDINALKIVPTASGSQVYIFDASNMNIEGIDFFGESKQLQITGKNLYPEYSVKSHTTQNTNALAIGGGSELGRLEPNTTYYIAFKGTVGNTYCLTSGFTAQTMITVGEGVNVISGTTKDSISGYNTVILNNYQNNQPHNFSDVMVMKVNEPEPYEPYTGRKASPSPDYPQPIESTIVNRVDVYGKNLLENTGNDIERIGLTYTMQSDGSVKVVGTTTEADYQVLIGQVTLPKGSYILNGAPNNICRLRIAKGTNSTLLGHDLGSGFSFTLEEESTVFVSVRTQSTVGTSINAVYYPMIRLATFTDATYEPYQSQTVNLSAPIELNGIGGVRDTIEIYSDGTGKYIQRIGKVVANKNTRFNTLELSTLQRVSFTITNMLNLSGRNADVLSSHFVASIEGTIYSMFHAGTEIYLYVGVNSTTDFNSFIADKEITFYYPIAEPIETSLPQADIDAIKALHSYKPNTVVMNDADAEMDVQYVADTKTYIDRKFEALASAIVNQ